MTEWRSGAVLGLGKLQDELVARMNGERKTQEKENELMMTRRLERGKV